MNLVIIKYNAGNIRSVSYALERLGVQAEITDDPGKIQAADKVIFPGVGEASSAMNYLHERRLDQLIRDLKQPFLGICLGMQLMCRYSEENNTPCLGVFDEEVKRFNPPTGSGIKVPQMGWNEIYGLKTPLFSGIGEGSHCYFVHGYYAAIGAHTIAKTDYGMPYSSALQVRNYYGVQFHPEKSAGTGEKIIQNFLSL